MGAAQEQSELAHIPNPSMHRRYRVVAATLFYVILSDAKVVVEAYRVGSSLLIRCTQSWFQNRP